MRKKTIGLTSRRAFYGYLFILPFILGFIFFMVKLVAAVSGWSKKLIKKDEEEIFSGSPYSSYGSFHAGWMWIQSSK